MSELSYINQLKKLIKSFDYRFLVFLMISILLWLSLQFSKTNIQTYSIGLNYIVPSSKLMETEPDQRIIVKLKSKTWNLLNSNKFSEKIDIRLQDRYTQVISEAAIYNLIKEYVDSKYEITSIIPSSISIDLIEPSKKKVPIILKGSLKTKSGYAVISTVKLIPDSVLVFGTANDIAKIDRWYTAEAVNTELSVDLDKLVDLESIQKTNSVKISPYQVRIQAEIDQFAERSFKRKIINSTIDSLYSIPAYALVKLAVPLRSLEKINKDDISISLQNYSYNDTISRYKLDVHQLPRYSSLLQVNPDSVIIFRGKK